MTTTDSAYFASTTEGVIHGMIDLETMGVGPTAPILTIGACLFNPYKLNTFEQLKDLSLYRVIDIEDTLKWCPNIEGGTLKWWLGQKADVINKLVIGQSYTLKNALIDLANLFTARGPASPLPALYRTVTPPAKIVWAKSPDFDCKIVENACRALGMPYFFHYSNHRCVRTILDAGFPDPDSVPERIGDAHDARDDAINQALAVQQAYKALGLHQEQTCPA